MSQSPAKSLGRAAAYPVIRLLEPRFADLIRRITDATEAAREEGSATRDAVAAVEPMIAGYAASSGESLTFVGNQLRELADEVRTIAARAAGQDAGQPLHGMFEPTAIAEAFALRALGQVKPPARLLDVHGAEGTLGSELATLGFDVLGVDTRPYLHEHPGLATVAAGLDALEPEDDAFAGALCLGGLGEADATDPWAADAAQLAHLRTLLADGAVVVLALALGSGVSAARAQYDERRLDDLLAGWEVLERLSLREQLPGTWVRTDAPQGRSIALIAARPA